MRNAAMPVWQGHHFLFLGVQGTAKRFNKFDKHLLFSALSTWQHYMAYIQSMESRKHMVHALPIAKQKAFEFFRVFQSGY